MRNQNNDIHPVLTPSPWKGWALFGIAAIIVFSLGMFATSIAERRHEANLPPQMLTPIAEDEPDSAVWGKNFPNEYESWKQTAETGSSTKYGGPKPFSHLERDPMLNTLFAGYPFSVEYNDDRGHMHSIEDVRGTARRDPARGGKLQPGTCLTCKSSNVPGLMKQMTPGGFYKSKFADVNAKISHPIGCADCHDSKTMNLRVSRPALREAYAAMGKDIDKVSQQELRSLVCAQCHVEYYFAKKDGQKKGTYLTFPWNRGTNIDQIEEYYTSDVQHVDWTHQVSKTDMIKMQHPDYELYLTGVHAERGVSCADCHMPYKSEGGMKFTDHHIQSPLKNVSNTCGVCHRWSEKEIIKRVETIQDKNREMMDRAERALVSAHNEIGKAKSAGATDAQLSDARSLVRRAQMRWDFINASNGMGFHSPQECARILASSIDLAQEARIKVAKLKYN